MHESRVCFVRMMPSYDEWVRALCICMFYMCLCVVHVSVYMVYTCVYVCIHAHVGRVRGASLSERRHEDGEQSLVI